MSVLIAANMTGTERCRLLVIGKAAKPRCFKGVKTLPVDYACNRKAWMTADIFKDWLTKLDRKFALSKRNVLLLVDQCSAHMNVPPLSAIRVAYLPANTLVLQPMDQGIIKNVKVLYRKHLLEQMLLCMDNASQYEVSLLSAIHMLARAWGGVKDETIANCFRVCGFIASGADDDSSCTVGEEDTSELDVDGLLPALGDVPFEEYVATESSVETCGALSDAEIVEVVRPSEASYETEVDDNDAASKPLPRAADVAAGLALVQRFFAAESNAKEALGHIYSLQNLLSAARFSKQKQTAITDFFS